MLLDSSLHRRPAMMASCSTEDEGIAVALLLLSSEREKRKRRFHVHAINKERESRGVMEKLYPQLCDDEDKFFNYTRMSRGTFEDLLTILEGSIRKQNTNYRNSIAPRERLLLTLR